MKLQIEACHENFVLPIYSTNGSAGLDFHALEDGFCASDTITVVNLGCKVAFSSQYAMLLTTRSGHGKKYGAGVPHGYGLIDSDYRGELCIVIKPQITFFYKKGDRIAQAIFVPVLRAELEIVKEVPLSLRGGGGFGSTGA